MVKDEAIRRGDVLLLDFGPSIGTEVRKARPCLVVSPDEMNRGMRTYIVAPMSTGAQAYPFRVPCQFAGKKGHVILDQIRAVDHGRLIRKVGRLSPRSTSRALQILREMFIP